MHTHACMHGRVCAFDIHIHLGGGGRRERSKTEGKEAKQAESGGGEEEEMQSASKRLHSPKRCEAVEHAQRQVADQVVGQIEDPGDETRGSQRSLFSRTCSRRVHQHAHAHAHERVWVCIPGANYHR